MTRALKTAACLMVLLASASTSARAQGWGAGGWSFGGWGGQTPEGANLNGMGRYAIGAGIYNYDTALANQINTQTAMQWNDYVAQVTHESAMIHHSRVHQEFLRDRTLYDAHIQKLRDNPSPQQIANGDALNQAVTDLSDPRLGESYVGRAATAPVDTKLIAEVPFENHTDRVTIMLEKLRAAFDWPQVFEEERFASDKKLFDQVVGRLRKEDESGDVSQKTLSEARQLVSDLRRKITIQPMKDQDDQDQALKFINASTALLGLLDKPDTRRALADLRKVPKDQTTVGNLLGFMHAYNLRFGPATTQKQRRAYQQLYSTLDQTRDQILTESKLDIKNPPSAHPKVVTDFYGRIKLAPEAQPNAE